MASLNVGLGLWIPSGGSGNESLLGGEVVSPECDEREETEQRWGGAQDGEIGPLALGFDAEMRPGFLERDFDLPTRDEPLEDVAWLGAEIGGEEGLRFEFASEVPVTVNST